jgi:hypothetical protein
LPVNGNGTFRVPSKREPITEYIIQNMRQRSLLKLQSDYGFLSSLRIEAPRIDGLFKIRRVEK